MKNIHVKKIICLSAAAMLGLGTPASVMAAEVSQEVMPAPETEGTDAAEAPDAAGTEERIPEDVTLTLQTGDVILKNETKRFFAGAEYKRAESRVLETETGEDAAETEVVAQTWDLVLTEEDGEVHTFEDVRADKWTDPVLTEEFGFLYVSYTDENEEKQECLETGEERNLEEPVTAYAVTEVNIREKADMTSQSLKVTSLGDELKVIAAVPGWVKVDAAGVTGYIHHEYVTEDKSKIDDLLAEKQTVQTALQTETVPQTNTQSTSNQQPQYSYEEPSQNSTAQSTPTQENSTPTQPTENESSSQETDTGTPDDSDEVVEIGREAMDDPDGSGHGYYEITYSDGSVAFEKY